MALNFPRRHPSRIERQELLVEALEAPRILRNQPRSEAAVTVPRDPHGHRPRLGLHGLFRVAVAAVGAPSFVGPVAALEAKMVVHLGLEHLVHHGLLELLEQPVGAPEVSALLRKLHQLRRQLRFDLRCDHTHGSLLHREVPDKRKLHKVSDRPFGQAPPDGNFFTSAGARLFPAPPPATSSHSPFACRPRVSVPTALLSPVRPPRFGPDSTSFACQPPRFGPDSTSFACKTRVSVPTALLSIATSVR